MGRRWNAFEPYPVNRPPRYNGSGAPCDMWVGPCSCGAWHQGAMDVLELLTKKARPRMGRLHDYHGRCEGCRAIVCYGKGPGHPCRYPTGKMDAEGIDLCPDCYQELVNDAKAHRAQPPKHKRSR